MSALQEAYAEKEPDVTVTYDPTGSGAGITGATDKTLDIGLSSRKLKDGETGVTATTIALDGIAIIVNNANPCAGSDHRPDRQDRHRRGYQLWKDVGGEDAPSC